MVKRLALVGALAAAALAARRRRSGRTETDLWAEATTGPQAVSTPTGP